ncbi:hypothetical protein J1N35_039695 [Gossypium stocksii]|uniref:DUF4283 domain-containing protein n=1 Tax=Gossypium stocksii TaxID=47602 RepID=A0A9D3UCB9_9ROSI|nr:hypothetical protein J1N35_039695 [Gossypium stocksii]
MNRDYLFAENPWTFDGAFFVFDQWRPGMVLRNLQLLSAPIWVQIWGLPLEYITPYIALNIGALVGNILQFDWNGIVPMNIRYFNSEGGVRPIESLNGGVLR